MTGDSNRPTEEKVSRRERLHARHRAEDTWRRHEIAGRLAALDKDVTKLQKDLAAMVTVARKAFNVKLVVDTEESPKELPSGDKSE